MLSDLRYRLRALFRRDAVERELDSELRFHLDKQIALEMASGASRAEAERRARLLLGGIDQVKESDRDVRGISPIEILFRDLRYAVRLLAKSPGFTLVAILSLTLGIGANTAMFQLLNAVVLSSLPVPDPQELVEIQMNDPDLDQARGSFNQYPSLTNPIFERIRERQQAFSSLIAWGNETFNLAPAGEIRRGRGLWVNGGFFNTLGVQPILGRVFTDADDRRGCGMSPGAVISYDFWQQQLAGDPAVIGRTLTVQAQRVDVIGVTPPGFYGLENGRTFDVALPICSIDVTRPNDNALTNGVLWWLKVVGRLKPGWTPAAADAHIRALSAEIQRDTLPHNYPAVSVKSYLASTFITVPASGGISSLRDRYARPIRLLLAMTGLVLLIACANLANLMITRGVVRSRELALRLALGASRARLISQLLSESLLIAAISAVAGLLLARVLSGSLVSLMGTSRNPIILGLTIDWRVFAFTAGTAALTCLLLGLAPALRASRGAPGDVLKAGTRGVTRDHESLTLRRTLLVAQVAISLVLVVGALLFVRTFRNLVNTPLGFQQENVLTIDAGLPPPSPSADVSRELKRAIRERLAAVPGVTGVAEASIIPLSGQGGNNQLWLDGTDPKSSHEAWLNSVSPGFFKTMGIPLLAGRDISDQDRPATTRVAVVNESFARIFIGGKNPIGQRFWIEQTSNTPEVVYEIVGVVRDSKYKDLREAPISHAFFAMNQSFGTPRPGGTFLVRTALPPEQVSPAIGKALLDVNPNLRFTTRLLDGMIRDGMTRERVMATLSALFGALAALLAAVGLHGIISYTVERRRREIGIRLALGASRGIIVRSVLQESGTWVGIGLTIGVLASLALTRTAQTLLYGVQSSDPVAIVTALTGLALVALLASYLPALRAARVDPMTTLKDE
jgi:putative ABC transport system permease protein